MVALPNPSFEPTTHRWCPGTVAPSREVPSQNCTFSAPKTASFGPKRPWNLFQKCTNKGKWLLFSTCALTSSLQRALGCPLTPRYVLETAQKWPKMAPIVRSLCQPAPKPRTGRILGYMAQIQSPPPPALPLTFKSDVHPQTGPIRVAPALVMGAVGNGVCPGSRHLARVRDGANKGWLAGHGGVCRCIRLAGNLGMGALEARRGSIWGKFLHCMRTACALHAYCVRRGWDTHPSNTIGGDRIISSESISEK